MKQHMSLRGILVLLVAFCLMAAACGSDGDDVADEATESETAEDTSTTEAAEESTTTEAEEETTTTEAAEESTTTEAAAEEASGIAVTLNDAFEILLAADPAAGSVTFKVANEGPDFPHALTIVRAASIDDLPRNEANGAIDLEAMDPADIVGSTSVPMAGGTAEDLTVELQAGDYVFFCPIQNDSQSHVAAGQIISVSVGG